MISIVVPVYKVEDVISKCIESIIAQTYSDWELILVDDGSPDKSGKICDEYSSKDSRIRVIHQSNSGVSTARNNGIAAAKGDYITFVDSDDYICPSFLSEFAFDFNADLQVMGMKNIYKNGQTEKTEPACNTILNVKETLSTFSNIQFFMSPWAKLFKMNIIKSQRILFPIDICYTEDEIFVKKYLLYTEKIRMVSASLYCYTHFNENSLASRKYTYTELLKCLTTDAIEYEKLGNIMGEYPNAYVQFCTRRKSFLFHRIVSTLITEPSVSITEKKKIISMLINKYKHLLQYNGDLPTTYVIERLCLKKIPLVFAIYILKFLLK